MVREQRRLAAIVAADVVGYSRLMGQDESGTLAALKALRQEVVDPAIASHGGRIVKTTGDGLLLEFPSVVNAVRCAVKVQTAMADRTSGSHAAEVAHTNVRVNLFDPGPMRTGLRAQAFPGEDPAKQTPPLAHAEALIRLALPSYTMTGQRVAGDAAQTT